MASAERRKVDIRSG